MMKAPCCASLLFLSWSSFAKGNLVALEAQVASEVATCIADPASTAFVDSITPSGAPVWSIPLDIAGRPPENSLNLQPPVDVPGIGVLPQGLQWQSQGIPPTASDSNDANYVGLPPPYDPANPFAGMLPPFFHLQSNPAKWGYNKWPALPFDIMAYFRLDPTAWQSADNRNTLFLKNLADRGTDNKLKKQYLSALTCDKMHLYEEKVTKMLKKFLVDIGVNGAPVLSTWKDAVFELYYSLHFGDTEVPNFVRDWVDDISIQLAFQIRGGVDPADTFDRALTNYCRSPQVDAWIEQRRLAILAEDDTSTFTYWWDKAGVVPESVVFEAAHNIIAFSQFVNTLFLLVRSKLQDTIGVSNVQAFLGGSATIGPIDFFQKYTEATTDNEKLDVTREAYRILLPNLATFSSIDFTEADATPGEVINDPTFNKNEGFHFHILIQASNDNYNFMDGFTSAGTYDTSRYANFQPPQKCPFMEAQQYNKADFVASAVDGETIVPDSHKEYFPVIGPKYCPFGFGYRKCPAELFNSFILGKMLEELAVVEFTTQASLFQDVDPGVPGFDTAVPIGLFFALDNIQAEPLPGCCSYNSADCDSEEGDFCHTETNCEGSCSGAWIYPATVDRSKCCSHNFRDCYYDDGDYCQSEVTCLNGSCGNSQWIKKDIPASSCAAQWEACTNDPTGCCDGLTCVGNQWYKQCLVQ